MSASFVTFDPTGNWEGLGVQYGLVRNSSAVEQIILKLVKVVNKYEENIYVVTDTYYYEDGTINYGPTNSLISTNGANNLTTADDTGSGIDTYLFSNDKMTFTYDANSISETVDPTYKAIIGIYNLVKTSILIQQSELFKNVDSAINTEITSNKIVGSNITEADFPNLEFIVDNNQTLDFTNLTIYLNQNGILTPIVVPGAYEIVKSKYDAVAKQAVAAGSSTFEPFKSGVFNSETIGEVIDELTNNQTYGILKVFSMTLTDNS
jgi:hypothetical protein